MKKKTITLYDGERHIHLFKIGAAELDIPELPDGTEVLGQGEHLVLPSTLGDTKSRLRFVAERGPKEIELAGEPPKWLSAASYPSQAERVPARPMQVRRIPIADIIIDNDVRQPNEDDIAEKMKSFDSIGMLTPITVKQEDDGPHLIAGRQRYETAKRLGWKYIHAAFFEGDDIDAKIWTRRENLDRLNYTALEKFEAIAETAQLEASRISRQKVAKGHGRPESAFKTAVRSLRSAGKTAQARTKTGEHALKVSRLPEEVKEKIKAQGLDDKPSALLEIAREKSPETQLEKISEIVKRNVRKQAAKRNRVKKSKAKAEKLGEKASAKKHPDEVIFAELKSECPANLRRTWAAASTKVKRRFLREILKWEGGKPLAEAD
jgi:ParB-like chromosome segregation protein Spo0J